MPNYHQTYCDFVDAEGVLRTMHYPWGMRLTQVQMDHLNQGGRWDDLPNAIMDPSNRDDK